MRCGSARVRGGGRYYTGPLVGAALTMRVTVPLSLILRMGRRLCKGGVATIVVAIMGVFRMLEMDVVRRAVATADVCGERGQNRTHAQKQSKRKNNQKSCHVQKTIAPRVPLTFIATILQRFTLGQSSSLPSATPR